MAHGFLRPLPEGAPRPDPMSDEVIARAVASRLDEIKSWLKPRIPSLEGGEIAGAITTALRAAGADGFRMAVVLKNEFSWPADMGLALLMRDVTASLEFSLRIVTAEWALRTGFRFPARSNHHVSWLDHADKVRMGTVVSVDTCHAYAVVQPFEGLVKAGEPRRVLAERVLANLSTDEHGVPSIDPIRRSRRA